MAVRKHTLDELRNIFVIDSFLRGINVFKERTDGRYDIYDPMGPFDLRSVTAHYRGVLNDPEPIIKNLADTHDVKTFKNNKYRIKAYIRDVLEDLNTPEAERLLKRKEVIDALITEYKRGVVKLDADEVQNLLSASATNFSEISSEILEHRRNLGGADTLNVEDYDYLVKSDFEAVNKYYYQTFVRSKYAIAQTNPVMNDLYTHGDINMLIKAETEGLGSIADEYSVKYHTGEKLDVSDFENGVVVTVREKDGIQKIEDEQFKSNNDEQEMWNDVTQAELDRDIQLQEVKTNEYYDELTQADINNQVRDMVEQHEFELEQEQEELFENDEITQMKLDAEYRKMFESDNIIYPPEYSDNEPADFGGQAITDEELRQEIIREYNHTDNIDKAFDNSSKTISNAMAAKATAGAAFVGLEQSDFTEENERLKDNSERALNKAVSIMIPPDTIHTTNDPDVFVVNVPGVPAKDNTSGYGGWGHLTVSSKNLQPLDDDRVVLVLPVSDDGVGEIQYDVDYLAKNTKFKNCKATALDVNDMYNYAFEHSGQDIIHRDDDLQILYKLREDRFNEFIGNTDKFDSSMLTGSVAAAEATMDYAPEIKQRAYRNFDAEGVAAAVQRDVEQENEMEERPQAYKASDRVYQKNKRHLVDEHAYDDFTEEGGVLTVSMTAEEVATLQNVLFRAKEQERAMEEAYELEAQAQAEREKAQSRQR